MTKQIFAIAVNEFKIMLKDKGALRGLFILPICFILAMTLALQSLYDTGTNQNPVRLLVVNQDGGQIAAKVIQDMSGLDGVKLIENSNGQAFTRAQAEDLIVAGRESFALVFPVNFSAQILNAAQESPVASKVSFIVDPAMSTQMVSPVRGMVEGYIEREASLAQAPVKIERGMQAVLQNMPASQAVPLQGLESQLVSQLAAAGGTAPGGQSSGVSYEVVPPAGYHAPKMPSSAQQNVPAYTIYGVFFIMQTIATSLFREKQSGTFRRLQASPLTPAAYLAGKILPYFLVNLVQIELMFTVGQVAFHLDLGNNPLALVLLSIVTAATATGLGLMLSTLGKTLEQVSSLTGLLAILLSVIGGMMVPVSIMPPFMQVLAKVTPHYWALNGFQDVIVRGLGFSAVLPVVGILLGYAAVFWGIAILRFRYD